jgi:hypothetical protein
MSEMLPIIKKGTAVPDVDTTRTRRPRIYPIRELKIGQAFFVPNRVRNNLVQYMSKMGRALGRKFTTRLIWLRPVKAISAEGKKITTWEECTETHPKAVRGIGVWRVQ